MKEKEFVTGYKVFRSDWTCNPAGNNPKQYSCPGTFEEDVTPSVGNRGMHFCKKLNNCFSCYSFDPDYKVAKVIALGKIDEDEDICCTNKLQIVEEISWEAVLRMVNLGKGNVGNCNSGEHNSGHCNSGNYNSGDHNSGHCNSGDYNSGDWNETNFSNGCFNTEEPKIFLFNKPSDWTYSDWLDSDARCLLNQIPRNVVDWINSKNMTDEEKEQHPEYEVVGGYLKILDESECRQSWWDSLSEEDKNTITAIPNFDEEVFEECTGIKSQKADMTLPKKANVRDNSVKETAVIKAVKINSFSEKDVENVLVFIGENAEVDEITQTTQTKFTEYCLCCKKRGFMYIKNKADGLLEAYVGDYIVRGANGDCYPCKPETFEFLKKIMKG